MGDAQAMTNPIDRTDRPRILVVEDEVLVRWMISEQLREQGYTVVEAINADEAASVLRSQLRVDLVLTDMRMPGSMNGAGLVKLLRAEFPFVKVVMVAGQVPDEAVRELLDDFLAKPFAPAELRDCIRKLTAPAGEAGHSS